jgi:hypothetical protein
MTSGARLLAGTSPTASTTWPRFRKGGGWGVAVGYNGAYGLCLLDQPGVEKWCRKDVGNVWFALRADGTVLVELTAWTWGPRQASD